MAHGAAGLFSRPLRGRIGAADGGLSKAVAAKRLVEGDRGGGRHNSGAVIIGDYRRRRYPLLCFT
jgi:hypothetical protein